MKTIELKTPASWRIQPYCEREDCQNFSDCRAVNVTGSFYPIYEVVVNSNVAPPSIIVLCLLYAETQDGDDNVFKRALGRAGG